MSPEKYRACEAIFACKVAQIGNKSYFCMLKIGKFLIGIDATGAVVWEQYWMATSDSQFRKR